MRTSMLLVCSAVALAAVPAFAAQSAPAPVAIPAQAAAGAVPRVLVIPFNVLNVPESQKWIGEGVQESLVASFARGGDLNPIPFEGAVVVEDNATAIRLAKAAGAAYAIRGTAQVVGDTVRMTAQLIDVRTGEAVQTAITTGALADILNLEDDVSGQLRGKTALGSPLAAPAAPAATGPLAPSPAVQAVAPQVIVVTPPGPTVYTPEPIYQPVYPDYAFDTSFYGYPFGYPYLYTVISVPRGHEHDHDHDHDGDHHDGDHHDGDHHDNNLSGPFHLVTQTAPGSGATALPLPTNNILPLPTPSPLPIPAHITAPVPVSHAAPPAPAAPAGHGGGIAGHGGTIGAGKGH